jgi:hypothetical protein
MDGLLSYKAACDSSNTINIIYFCIQVLSKALKIIGNCYVYSSKKLFPRWPIGTDFQSRCNAKVNFDSKSE